MALWGAQKVDSELTSIQEGHSTAEHPVEAALAEIEDLLSYFNDILANSALQHNKYTLYPLFLPLSET
jgi:hypothetical protein